MATSRVCSIHDCDKPAYKRGWCSAHYSRWHRHGDPFGGAPMRDGEPLRFFLEVVLPYEGDECLLWPFGKTDGGYGTLWVDGKKHIVSRLVCERSKGPPPPVGKYDAAHSCGHEGCCTKRHMSWKTRAENNDDKLLHDTHNRGERCYLAKLTEADVHQIRSLRGKMPQRDIASLFGLTPGNISHIHRRKSWAWLD